MYINCKKVGENMTQHTEKVIRQDKLNKLAEWRKGIKYIIGERKKKGSVVVVHQTIYKDDIESIEYLKSKRKTKFIPSPHSDDDLIYEMEREDYDKHRSLFDKSNKI